MVPEWNNVFCILFLVPRIIGVPVNVKLYPYVAVIFIFLEEGKKQLRFCIVISKNKNMYPYHPNFSWGWDIRKNKMALVFKYLLGMIDFHGSFQSRLNLYPCFVTFFLFIYFWRHHSKDVVSVLIFTIAFQKNFPKHEVS